MSAAVNHHPGLNLGEVDPQTDEAAEVGIFGFWLFLMSDAIIFALLFATYGTMVAATAGGPRAIDVFKMGSAFAETMLLLASSFTFGLASLAMKHDRSPRALVGWMVVTLLLGLGFLGLELNDFLTMFAAGAYPTRSGFLSAFFALVPLHGLHVTAGSIWLIVMLVQIATIGLDRQLKINIMRLALFWHFLDIVWIAIFSVVYLQGLAR